MRCGLLLPFCVAAAIQSARATPECVAVTTCPSSCPTGTSSVGVLIPLGPDSQLPGVGIQQWQASAFKASQLLLALGNSSRSGDPFVEFGDELHTTLLYLCCLTLKQARTVLALLDARPSPLLTGLRFDRAVCIASNGNHDVVVSYDNASEAQLQAYAARVESDIRSAGVPVKVPRSSQVFFHSTLAEVLGTGPQFPFERATSIVNAQIPPLSWVSSSKGFDVQQVCCNWPNRTGGACALPKLAPQCDGPLPVSRLKQSNFLPCTCVLVCVHVSMHVCIYVLFVTLFSVCVTYITLILTHRPQPYTRAYPNTCVCLYAWLLASTLVCSVRPSCALKVHGKTLNATADGQIIENVAVHAPPGAAAITVAGFKSVTIRNVNITFGNPVPCAYC